ncbi:hypothetical protein DSECCO2_407540 [anaerobic digester metagenome]
MLLITPQPEPPVGLQQLELAQQGIAVALERMAIIIGGMTIMVAEVVHLLEMRQMETLEIITMGEMPLQEVEMVGMEDIIPLEMVQQAQAREEEEEEH